uniref:Uncharacterized protein n=1 Tax=Cucumis melo TaxID=3656 RepID=A0A9I9EI16_CUCME
MSQIVPPRGEWTHHRLCDFAKTALIKIFSHPYVTVRCLTQSSIYVYDLGACMFVICIAREERMRRNGTKLKSVTTLELNCNSLDESTSGIGQMREAWESQKKAYTAEFFEVDPCVHFSILVKWERDKDVGGGLLEDEPNKAVEQGFPDQLFELLKGAKRGIGPLYKCSKFEQHQLCVLKPKREQGDSYIMCQHCLNLGAIFLGLLQTRLQYGEKAKYQKNVEAYHNRSAGMKPNIVPNCIRSESYMISFEVEEEKLAREAGLEYIEIQNLTEFFDDHRFLQSFLNSLFSLTCVFSGAADYFVLVLIAAKRAQLADMLMNFGQNILDPRGRLLPRSYDVLGLYTTFIFQKPDPDITPPIMTPLLPEISYDHEEASFCLQKFFTNITYSLLKMLTVTMIALDLENCKCSMTWERMLNIEWQGNVWRDEERSVQAEHVSGQVPVPVPVPVPIPVAVPVPVSVTVPVPVVVPLTVPGLGKISEQKGILGPGPADLRFPEAL